VRGELPQSSQYWMGSQRVTMGSQLILQPRFHVHDVMHAPPVVRQPPPPHG